MNNSQNFMIIFPVKIQPWEFFLRKDFSSIYEDSEVLFSIMKSKNTVVIFLLKGMQ